MLQFDVTSTCLHCDRVSVITTVYTLLTAKLTPDPNNTRILGRALFYTKTAPKRRIPQRWFSSEVLSFPPWRYEYRGLNVTLSSTSSLPATASIRPRKFSRSCRLRSSTFFLSCSSYKWLWLWNWLGMQTRQSEKRQWTFNFFSPFESFELFQSLYCVFLPLWPASSSSPPRAPSSCAPARGAASATPAPTPPSRPGTIASSSPAAAGSSAGDIKEMF